ncbi:MAG: tripartite tricarboxylate transporter substrate binding protein [Chloroflexi bacterium]|nr:tripartite tricarboxylate transporter substrate binding protein [Chloroflexota bacterium]
MKTLRIVSVVLLATFVVLFALACQAAPTPTPVPPTKAPIVAPTAVPPTVAAQPATKFPEKPITLVVHASAGGGSDIFARTLAAVFEKEKILAQPIVVENKPGGSGAVAFAYVAGKKADPYFMLTAVTSFLTTPLQGLSEVSYKDFTPLANFAFDEYMLMVKAESKYKSMKELIDDAKAKPEKTIKAGGTQLGSADSICAYLIEKATGVKFNYIVFNSGGEVNAALLGGHIDIAVSNPGEALELAKGNKIRNLGVFAEKRLAGAPDVPTMKEQGIDALYVQNRGLVMPGNIGAAERKVLEDAMLKYTKTDTYKKYVKDQMLTEAWMDGATFGKWIEGENARYLPILKDMGLIKSK